MSARHSRPSRLASASSRAVSGAERRALDERPRPAGSARPAAREGAGAAREHDALLGAQPRRRLRAPAEERVLEITDHRERESARALRDPVDDVEGARREPAEVALVGLHQVLPALRRAQRERIEHQAERPGKHQEPEERPEGAVVRLAQRVLGGEPRDRSRVVGLDRLALPLRQQVRGGGHVLLAQRLLDRGERARGGEEAQRPVEHRDVEEPHHHRMDRGGDPGHEHDRHHHGGHERGPGEHAGIAIARVEALCRRKRHAPVEGHERRAPLHRIGVLGEEAGEDREEAQVRSVRFRRL